MFDTFRCDTSSAVASLRRETAQGLERALRYGLVAGLAALGGCADGGAALEEVASTSQPYGSYDLTSYYNKPAEPRGWIIEWEVPQLLNPETAVGVIGQWYNGFESGIYYIGGRWSVYYFGDGNGLAGNEPSCNSIWGSGGTCDGIFSGFEPGQRVVFKYEFCTPDHVASVDGTQNCLYVDLNDGAGFRFLAEDTSVRLEGAEMYAHDIEHFRSEGYVMPQIPCSAPTKMARQEVKNTDGSWTTLSGPSHWRFNAVSPYKFQNQQLDAVPATWETCSRLTASVALRQVNETNYCADITVSNAGPEAISNWSVEVDLNQSTMSNNWSANFSQSGSRYTLTPMFWNASIAAGGSQTVGFCASKTGANWTPIVVAQE